MLAIDQSTRAKSPIATTARVLIFLYLVIADWVSWFVTMNAMLEIIKCTELSLKTYIIICR